MKKVALITGGSSGIGKETAIALAAKGFIVYELSRKPSKESGVVHISCDVTNAGSVEKAVAEIVAKEKQIDVLINNAGFGISGAIEFTDEESAKRQFDVNFFGAVNVSKAVLPIMRKCGVGRIVNVSSVAAVVPIPFQAFYSASKAAINSFTLALCNEVKPYGISVCAVMLGDVKTSFTAARKKIVEGDDEYGGRISKSVQKMENDEENGMSPKLVGENIARIASKKRIKPLYAVRADYKAACFLAKILPARIMNGIVFGIYAK